MDPWTQPHVTLSIEWSRIGERKIHVLCVYCTCIISSQPLFVWSIWVWRRHFLWGNRRQYMDFFVIKPGLTFVFRAVSLFPGKRLDTCETISRGKLDHFSKRTNPLWYWAVGSRHSDFLRRKMHPDVGWRVKETSRHHYWLFFPCTLCTVPSLKICCFTQWWHITSFFFSPSL